MDVWKVLAGVFGVATLGLGTLLYKLARDFMDGWGEAFGYPHRRRWFWRG